MIPNTGFFHILYSHDIDVILNNELIIEKVWVKHDINSRIETHPYFCIFPDNMYTVNLYVKEYHEGHAVEEDRLDSPLAPIESCLYDFIFIKLESGANNEYLIVERFEGAELFEYWMNRNTFPIETDYSELLRIGITKKTIDLIPNNHNYYDRNLICTCGYPDCHNLSVWIIKHTDTFCIPFIIDLGIRLRFDLGEIIKLYDDRSDDYFHYEGFDEKHPSETFPLCFEYPGYELNHQTMFPNEDDIAATR